MVHPSEIMRANSDVGSQFSAPVTGTRRHLDCGWTAVPCLAERFNLVRFAKVGTFLGFFTFLGFLHGAVLSYFRATSHIWSEHYQMDDRVLDWLLYSNELFVGAFALLITYWGNRIHRVSWIGGLAIFQAFACIFLVIPETHVPNIHNLTNKTVSDFLCTKFTISLQLPGDINYIAIVILFLFQMFFGFASISFYTLGISYLDDNIEKDNAPIFLANPLAGKIFGTQLGLYLSWIPALSSNLTIFTTPTWLVLASLIFLFASIVTLFPSSLPAMALKKAVASLLSLAEGVEEEEYSEDENPDGFFDVFIRLVTNPVLMLNITAAAFAATAFVNMEIFQNRFFQSRFFVQVGSDLSGYQDNLISKIANMIKYPLLGISVIATGFILAKTQPKAKYLALMNVIIYSLTASMFISFPFLNCDVSLHSERPNKLTMPFCSSNCFCPKTTPFMPVCTVEGQKTYFSPCHAGCQSVSFSNTKIYSNCTCGEDLYRFTNTEATEGTCDRQACSISFVFAQAGIVSAASCFIATILTNILINLRIVRPSDKAMALALECTFLGIFPYVPGKMIYKVVSESLCRYYGSDRCLLNSKYFGLFYSVSTIVLFGIAALISVGVVLLIGDVPLWTKDDKANDESDEEDAEDESPDWRNRQVTDAGDPSDLTLRTPSARVNRGNEYESVARRTNRDTLESEF